MKITSPLSRFLCVSGSLLISASASFGATASTNPLGYTTVTCPAGSDTLCSTAGLTQKPEFVGKVDSFSGADLTLNGVTGWSDDQFNETHYVRFVTGVMAGSHYTVTDTVAATGTVTLDLNGNTLTGVTSADQVKLVPHWTLATLFPQGIDTVQNSLNTSSFGRRTVLFFPDVISPGINLAASQPYFRVAGDPANGDEGWRQAVGASTSTTNDQIVEPDVFFIIRHRDAPLGQDTDFVPMGHVETAPVVIPLPTLAGPGAAGTPAASGEQDVATTLARPIPVSLSDLGLISSGAFVPSIGTSSFGRRDTLLVFDNTSAAINKPAAKIYYYDGSSWRDSLNGNAVSDTDLLEPGTGFVIRKKASAGGVTSFWLNQPTY